MTNGEKMLNTFHGKVTRCDETVFFTTGGWHHAYDAEWWNAEYKEPTTKNDLGVREFEGIEVTYPPEEVCIYPEYKGKPYFAIKYKENGEEIVGYGTYNPEVLSQYLKGYFISTTKNNLGVDCIDRAELLKAMNTWDKFGYTTRYGLERLDKDDKGFVPYVKYDDMVNCVKGMPSVTPQLSSELEKNSKKLEKGTTKNDLGVDCINRATVLHLINDVNDSDGFKDYSQYEYLFDQVDMMPSVTPQLSVSEVTALAEWTEKLTKASEDAYNKGYADGMKAQEPKTGEWIEHFDESGKWYECDQCHTDWGGAVNFCPDCGADMRGVKE